MPRRSAAGDADTQHGNSAALIASLRDFCNSVRPIERPNGNGTRRKRPKAFNRHKSLDTLSYACVLNDTAEYSDNRSDTHACSSTNNTTKPSRLQFVSQCVPKQNTSLHTPPIGLRSGTLGEAADDHRFSKSKTRRGYIHTRAVCPTALFCLRCCCSGVLSVRVNV